MGIISDTLDAVTLGLLHPASAGPNPVTNDDLVPLVSDLTWLGKTVDDVFAEAADQAAVATLQATAAGADIDNAVQDLRFSVEHTYKTVLPHSLAWLRGNIVHLYITPLRARIGKVETRITALETWRADIHKWRVSVVDPTLNDYRSFKRLWQSWPLDMVTTVRTWLNKPTVFAQFAVPAIADKFIGYLLDNANAALLDALLTALIDASPDRYRHVVAAGEAMLDKDWP